MAVYFHLFTIIVLLAAWLLFLHLTHENGSVYITILLVVVTAVSLCVFTDHRTFSDII